MTGETYPAPGIKLRTVVAMPSGVDKPIPNLDEETRVLVRRALASRVVTLGEIKAVVASLMTASAKIDSDRLMDGLRNAGLVTRWQAAKLLAGKSRGFFLGPYKLLRPIGRGGMGLVYLAEHRIMKRRMALKVLPAEALDDARRIERFKDEARASAQLDHVNIVRAYDINEDGKRLYIVMELVDGIDLHRLVTRDGVLPHSTALNAITQACEGLVHAHQRGVVHRDIKPSNLLLRNDGVVKVADMGLARIGWSEVDDISSSKRLMGTADFAAPEQAINSRTVDARADLYSLGCTWYFLLTGRTPYHGKGISQRLAQHQTAPVPDVRRLRSDCPEKIAELLKRMMAKKRSQRPSSASELLLQLHQLRSGRDETDLRPEQVAEMVMHRGISTNSNRGLANNEESSAASDSTLVVTSAGEGLDEFDFASLPPMDTTDSGALSDFTMASSSDRFTRPRTEEAMPSRQSHPQSDSISSSNLTRPEGQLVMLGIGLTIAVLALVMVIGVAAYTISRPTPQTAPKIKSLEYGNQHKVIIVE